MCAVRAWTELLENVSPGSVKHLLAHIGGAAGAEGDQAVLQSPELLVRPDLAAAGVLGPPLLQYALGAAA